MRKNLIAMSAVAALGTFGLVGGAAAQMAVNAGGTGHQLVFPYFTSQGDSATSIALVNTDTSAGKVVKVRFRGAVNSDDVLDFQVLMSPGDVWTAAVTAGTDGKSRLSTSDASCTVPDTIRTNKGVDFVTDRVDPKATDVNAQTREGYIEVINMADIPAGSALFTATKHVSGVAPCTAATISSALSAVVSTENTNLKRPTGRLAGDYIIVQSTNRAAWSGSATALVAGADGAAANLVFWPQNNTAIVGTGITGPAGVLTSDPLAGTDANTALNTGFTLRNYDLPDLSTPYDATSTTSGSQLTQTIAALRTTSTINQFETSPAIGGLTDIVFTQPLRRYMAAVNYTSGAGVYTASTGGFTNPLIASTASGGNTSLESRQICLTAATASSTDREEASTTSTFVVSPGTPTTFKLCGEVAVATVNSTTTSALNAALTSKSSSAVVTAGYNSGWLQISTGAYTSAGAAGLPFIGAAFVRASAAGQNYGFTFGNKTSR